MDISNERLLAGARNLKKKGYSPEQVDAWLQTKGSSLDVMKSFATQQKQASQEASKMPEVSDEARAEIARNIENYENPSWLKRLKNIAEINHASNEGFVEGIDNALNRATNAVTLGAFNKLSQLTGGNEYLKDKELRERNASEDLGIADALSGLAVEIPTSMATTGGVIYDMLGNAGLKGATRVMGAAGLEGSISNAIQSEKLKDVPTNAFAGGVVGTVMGGIPTAAVGGYNLTKRVVRPTKEAVKSALEKISELAGGEAKVAEAAQNAATRGRSALEVGSREIAQAADQARLGSTEANQMLNTFVDAERAAKADANRKIIDDVFGSRTKAQNTDAIIERTKEIASPIYDKLNKAGDLAELEILNKLKKVNPSNYDDVTPITGLSADEYADILRKQAQDLGVDIAEGNPSLKNGGVMHFILNEQGNKSSRAPFVGTLKDTFNNPDISFSSGSNANLVRGISNTTRPERFLDNVVTQNGQLYTKYPASLSNIAKKMRNPHDNLSISGRFLSDMGISPSEGSQLIVSNLDDFVKKNDFIQKEIGKVRADTTWDKAIREAPDTDFRLMDAVKKNIDDQIEVAKRVGKNDKVMRLQIQKTGLVNAMDQVVPEYKTARQVHEIKGKVLSAQKIGEKSLDGKVTAETLGRKMREMEPAERQAVGIGMKESILSNIGSKENEALALKQLLSKNNQDKLRLVLGRRQANNIIDYAKDEVSAYRNFNEALKGSQTAERLKASEKVSLIQNILRNPMGVVGEVMNYATKPSENATNKAIVELLTEKGGSKLNQAILDKASQDVVQDAIARLLAVSGGKAGGEF